MRQNAPLRPPGRPGDRGRGAAAHRRDPAAGGHRPGLAEPAPSRAGRADPHPAVRPGHRGAGGPLRLGDLAAAEKIAPSTLTRLVTVLEERGYVERHPVPGDARASTLVITPDGARHPGADQAGEHHSAGRQPAHAQPGSAGCPGGGAPRAGADRGRQPAGPRSHRLAGPAGRWAAQQSRLVRRAGWTGSRGPWPPAGHRAGRRRTGGPGGPGPGPDRLLPSS